MSDDLIGRRIRAYRKLKGFTQRSLAEKMGISVAVIGAVERGTRTAKRQLLEDIADTLDIDVSELFPEQETGSFEGGRTWTNNRH